MPIEIGQKVGLLTIVERGDRDPKLGRMFRCLCRCGSEKVVPQSNLLTGNTRSCGCLKLRANGLPYRGASRLPEFQIWKLMRIRCEDPRDSSYDRYGGRGIKVCDRWSKFDNFLADMGRRPSANHTLDRIDNDGNYEPGNCRWASWYEQQNNRRDNRRIEFAGRSKTIPEWSRELSIPATTLRNRIFLLGWPLEQAFQRATRPRPSRR